MTISVIEDTIAAISTPIGEGGIAIVRLSGVGALSIADTIFVSRGGKPSEFKTYTMHYGHAVKSQVTPPTRQEAGQASRKSQEIVDEVLLTVMKAPKSYTREDVVEINCHGGIRAAKKVLELAIQNGARPAEPGEFTKRAFLNGRIDLAQAEAVIDVIRAKTEGSLKVALNQLDGGLSKDVNFIREDILDITAQIEAGIDFPEEDIEVEEKKALTKKIDTAAARLKNLLDTYDNGIVLREGVLAIICGKPNAGKSSLMNLLLKRDRVIVSSIPGTTRDAVEEFINLGGVPIRLVDTAGIAKSKNVLDKEGIKKSKKYLALADIVVLMLDASVGIEKADIDIIKLIAKRKKIVVINKCDMKGRVDRKKLEKIIGNSEIIEISVKKKKNIDAFEKKLKEMMWGGEFIQQEASIISNVRHKALLDKAYKCMLSVRRGVDGRTFEPELLAIDLKDAVLNLGLIIGKSVSDDVLDRIFERFCIGK